MVGFPKKKYIYFNVHSFLSSLFTRVTCSLQTASSRLRESYEEKAAHTNCGYLHIVGHSRGYVDAHMELKPSSQKQ